MINRNILKVLAAGIFLILFAVTAALADEYGQIRGTVSDTTGAVIAGVQLTATNVATGIAATTTSKSDGSFEFLQLHSPATYKVTAERVQRLSGERYSIEPESDFRAQCHIGTRLGFNSSYG